MSGEESAGRVLDWDSQPETELTQRDNELIEGNAVSNT